MRLSRRAEFLVDNLDLPSASQVDSAEWEQFQLEHLSYEGIFRIENKSRQIAWSFLIAAEAVANAVLNGESSVFTSINLEEAQEKIIYARRILRNLNISGLPKITAPDTTTAIGFENDARIISFPSKPPRGKGKFWLYIDEWAHQVNDRSIYTGGLPIISKGGKMRGGSSPMGATGIFWEIFKEQMRPYPGFSRKTTPWWEVKAFCVNVEEAYRLAPTMDTAARVEMFGTDSIKAIFANMLLDDFQQEYECIFVDETSAWITWEEIRKNQAAFNAVNLQWWHAKSTGEAVTMTQQLKGAMQAGHTESAFVGGVDVGRRKDKTEFFILGKSPTGLLPVRMIVTLDRVKFAEQENCIRGVIEALPLTNVLIDETGIGMQLAENLRNAGVAQGVSFTNTTKELWAVEARKQAQNGMTPLPPLRDLAYQIHSIKRNITAAKNITFDTERNEKHHADKFWAWALAIYAAKGRRRSSII